MQCTTAFRYAVSQRIFHKVFWPRIVLCGVVHDIHEDRQMRDTACLTIARNHAFAATQQKRMIMQHLRRLLLAIWWRHLYMCHHYWRKSISFFLSRIYLLCFTPLNDTDTWITLQEFDGHLSLVVFYKMRIRNG